MGSTGTYCGFTYLIYCLVGVTIASCCYSAYYSFVIFASCSVLFILSCTILLIAYAIDIWGADLPTSAGSYTSHIFWQLPSQLLIWKCLLSIIFSIYCFAARTDSTFLTKSMKSLQVNLRREYV